MGKQSMSATLPKTMSLQLFAVDLFLCLFFIWGFTAGEDVEMIQASPGNSCSLKCTAQSKPGVQYLRVMWYRVGQEHTHIGLITRKLPNGVTTLYANVNRDVKFVGDSYDMILSNVSCSDHALFACSLWAPVGEQNRKGQIRLDLKGCPSIQPRNVPKKDCALIITLTVVSAALLLVIIYGFLKIVSIKRNKTPMKTTVEKKSLNAPPKPLTLEDFKPIKTLGPKTVLMNV